MAARLFAAQLHERGNQVVIKNQDGGAGLIAYRRMLASSLRPEILVGPATPMVTGLLSEAESFALRRPSQLICQIYDSKIAVVVRRSDQLDIAELLASGEARVSSGGPRSIPYLALKAATTAAGQQFTHIPFRGEYFALLALAQREVEAAVVTYSSFVLASPNLALSVSSGITSANGGVAELKSFDERFEFTTSPAVVLVQPGASVDLIKFLTTECERFTADEIARDRLVRLGFEPSFRTGQDAGVSIDMLSRSLMSVVSE